MRKIRVFGQLMGVQGMVVGDVTMQPDPRAGQTVGGYAARCS